MQEINETPGLLQSYHEQLSCVIPGDHKIPRVLLEMCNLKKMKTFQQIALSKLHSGLFFLIFKLYVYLINLSLEFLHIRLGTVYTRILRAIKQSLILGEEI